MVATVDSTSTPYTHVHGTTAEVLAYLLSEGVEAHQIVAIWDATVGPMNCVFMV